MLNRIFIKDYILIDQLDLELSKGLNILTGETGAGKSILINAIDIAFGAKCGKEVIRAGAQKAVIEITLINNKQEISSIFQEYGVDEYEEEIVVSREITQTGSRSRVNGCLVNQEFIKFVREKFIDIHSQHQTYSFLQTKYHIALLDSYIKSSILSSYKKEFEVYKSMLSELEQLQNTSKKTEEQIDFLKFQAEEIRSAEIKSVDEDEELKKELLILENAEKLKELTGSSYWSLSSDENSILEALLQIKTLIAKASSLDNSLEEIENQLIDSIEKLKDVSSNLREYSSSLENDTERLNQIQERLFLLDKLKRKYGGSLEQVIISGENFDRELDSIEFSTQNIEKLEKEIGEKKSVLLNLAEKISEERKHFASILSEKIVKKLEKLELPKVKFEINFEKSELGINGIDKVEFLISTNISEELKPLAKVASGGEVSRVMLAIKTIFAKDDNIETVIFDEIDTGISGKTSQSVADEVKELSEYMQIIMITHQAIIASKSDMHIHITKTQGDTTKVDISILDGEKKIKAIAELAGGKVTEETLEFAKILIK